MNIGLVLSGGMAKGAYQLGVLQALDEFIPLEEVKYISCASIGVLNGYAYATRQLAEAKQIWNNICDNGTRMLISRILRSSMLQQNIDNISTSSQLLSSVLYCSLLDITHKNIVYKNLSSEKDEEILLYLKASVAMPVYNRAVKIDGISYFDGAMVDNIPIYPLLKENLDYVICIYFDDICYKFENTLFDNRVIKITFPNSGILRESVVFEKESIQNMIQIGYNRAVQILNFVLSKGYNNIEYIYKNIEFLYQTNKKGRLRITGDILTTNLNKVTQMLIKKKIL